MKAWPVQPTALGAILAILVLVACVVFGIVGGVPLAILVMIGLLALARLC